MSVGTRMRQHYAARTIGAIPALNLTDFEALATRLQPLVTQYTAGPSDDNLKALNARIAELRGRLDSLDAAVAQVPDHFKQAHAVR